MLRSHLKRHGDDFAYMQELGLVLVQQGRRKEAIKEYLSAMREFPHHSGLAGLYCDLGLAYEFSKEEDKALSAYLKAWTDTHPPPPPPVCAPQAGFCGSHSSCCRARLSPSRPSLSRLALTLEISIDL